MQTSIATADQVAMIEGSHDEEFLVEGDDPQEVSDLTIAEDQRSVRTQAADREIESLWSKWHRGKLDLQPIFQRHFVWDRSKSSRLIESALLGIPLPIIYLAEEYQGRESVIDGQQRLTALFSFMDGKFPDGDPFRLAGLRVYSELKGLTYKELPEPLQERIRAYPIRVVTILKDSDPDLKFEIFERLNTGAIPLNDMELRNCIFRGPYMELLKDLAAEPDFRRLLGFKQADDRMRDVELVLRFSAFYHATYLRYQSPMRRFFNTDMADYRQLSVAKQEELRAAFKNAVQIVWSLFGESAFKRFYPGTESDPRGSWETKRFNASLYDVMMGVFADKDKNQVYAALDALREGLIDLMASDAVFADAILIGTSEPVKVRRRFDLTRMRVDDILQSFRPQPRCFSLDLKRELFNRNPTCALCGNQIVHLDDAAVDHVEQYWKGGKTIPENARLTHRYCNNSRPRND